jgi:hypothetical protein
LDVAITKTWMAGTSPAMTEWLHDKPGYDGVRFYYCRQ